LRPVIQKQVCPRRCAGDDSSHGFDWPVCYSVESDERAIDPTITPTGGSTESKYGQNPQSRPDNLAKSFSE
jgi:hypothetical protein